ncbi:TonB-dependent receptor plug domain-containing protein [Aliikangiella sp. IMCC44359]|uniref:TonB-dependent receptor plug domain-containing protein n=1 Tax=Aliikangiella sp. IMCC44359 TaxID=3459125 RepID=UPI00403A8D2A
MNFKYSKLSLAVILSMSVSPAFAEEKSSDSDEADQQVIQITGSRLQRSTAAAPVPTTVVSASQIEQLGFTNTGDILNSLPAIAGSVGARSGSGGTGDTGAGLELANLRGLGRERTLVLVDGRRHVGSSLSNTSVDVGSIPVQMIERVEVITGAAGAVYGADAVSGVINFILKKSYDGFKADVKYSEASEGDGETTTVSLLSGKSFAGGRGNVMASLDVTDREGVMALDRSWSYEELSWINSESYTPGYNMPMLRLGHNIGFSPLSREGYVSQFGWHSTNIGALPTQTFNADGSNRDFNVGYCQGAIVCEGGDSFKTHDYDYLSVPTERALASVVTSYDFGEHELFANLKYSQTVGNSKYQGGLSDGYYGPLAEIQRDNPYLAQYTDITSAMDDAGITSVFVNKAYDGFDNTIENKFDTFQIVLGASGLLTDSIEYEFSVQHGQTDVELRTHTAYVDRFMQGINAVSDGNGGIVCADTSNGCVPINPFGYKSVSPEAAAWVNDNNATRGQLTQSVANFSINGDLFELDAGTVQFVAGLEYRKEESETTVDHDLTLEDDAGHGILFNTYYGGAQLGEAGEYDVSEVFGEILIPLISDAPFAKELTFEAAARYSDYSTVGGQTAYKLGLNWVINDEVRFRATNGLAVRAPNIGELFQPLVIQPVKINDPCSATYINLGSNPAQRAENCASLGIPDGWISFHDGGEAPTYTSGNSDLEAEESTTSSAGIVYTPFEGFSIGLDYWDIVIDNAISSPSNNEILNSCYDFSDMTSNTFCALQERDPVTHEISRLVNQQVNVATLNANGFDLEMNYSIDVDTGSLLFNFVGSYYGQRDQVLNEKKPDEVLEGVNVQGSPKARAYLSTTYRQEDWNSSVIFNYIGSSRISLPSDSGERLYHRNHVNSVLYINLRGAYSISESAEIYANINNLADKGPQMLPGLQMGSNIYDAIGRTYTLGVKYEF